MTDTQIRTGRYICDSWIQGINDQFKQDQQKGYVKNNFLALHIFCAFICAKMTQNIIIFRMKT